MSTQNLKEKVLHSVADDTSVDLETTFQDAHIQKVLDQLNSELVGWKSVKTRVKEIAALLLVRARQTLGLTSVAPSLHICFAGNPGMGISSQIAHWIDFSDYTIDESLAMLKLPGAISKFFTI